ncbi:hypothetical protein GW571_07165 [Clavibacter capsici]|uniref:hypothetical protein n=1 Tax=Clavibacter capsici TaxID=1874630 RepID=UPI0014282E7E|nr:hypothetical protein [Clavibacter capsici]QIS41927.1 hypothetical protein GW571_07165 [Clavibacter capsici]
MTPSHDAPDTGPTSFDDGPAPATLGLSRREMRAAERARALALGIDEADDAPVEERAAASVDASERPAAEDAPQGTTVESYGSSEDDGSGTATGAATTPAAAPITAPGVGPDTSAILLSGGVLTRRQLRAIREAEEAARQQRGSEHGDDAPADGPASGAEVPSVPEADAVATTPDEESGAPVVDDAPPATSAEPAVPPYVRYGRGSRATPRPRAPYGSAYRRTPAADATEAPETATSDVAPAASSAPDAPADVEAPAVTDRASDGSTLADDRSSGTPSAWPFAPIVPSGAGGDRDVDASGEQPTVPPLAPHTPSRDEHPRPAPSLEPVPWVTGSAAPTIEPAFGTRASAAAEDVDSADIAAPASESGVGAPSATQEAAADVRTPFTPPTGHWSVQDQVDEDQPHTGNHFILPTVPHANDMQQALNSTGEIIITGSIDLPRSLGSMGTHPDRFDTADMDRILEQADDQDHAPGRSDSEPVRASRAVSTHTSTRAVVQPPPRKRFTAPVVAAVTAGGVAVIGAGLVIVAFMTNVF